MPLLELAPLLSLLLKERRRHGGLAKELPGPHS